MASPQPQHIDLDNPEFQQAWDLIRNTNRSVFLTGKAGTGKSTFLKYICANVKKKFVILAPTGIAAVNVGGQTLHSFFKIPFRPIPPDDPDYSARRIRKSLRYSSDKVKLIKALEMIVIDEISMVRADIIDFVDKVLRIYSGNMREPFGGKQLLLVGDIFQLEPVVTADARNILQRYYKQSYFFDAIAFSQINLVPIELRKIYRQSDSHFVSLLDRVRVNHATKADLDTLNARCNPNYHDSPDSFSIYLATRRDTVDSINEEHMRELKTDEHTFVGKIDGTFPDNDLPTSRQLVLKEGAQVMFIRNDKDSRWYNGTIGKVSRIDDEKVEVELEDGNRYYLEKETWEKIQYSYNEKEHKVVEQLLGTFEQLPVKPAWAITVHKSQGLTFNKVVIDFAGGAFASGQTYVALSRCTSLEGITLLRPMSDRDILVSLPVVEFSRQFNNSQLISKAMLESKARGLLVKAVHAFDHNEWRTCVESFAQAQSITPMIQLKQVQRLIALKLNRFNSQQRKITQLEELAEAQRKTLHNLAQEYAAMGNQVIGRGNLAGESEVAYRGAKAKLDEVEVSSAFANFDKALRIYPKCVEALTGRARLWSRLSEPQKALDAFKKALEIYPQSMDALMGVAEVHIGERNMPAAIKALKRAAKADKKDPLPHSALADVYDKMNLDDMAEKERATARKLRAAQKPKRKPRRPKE